MTLKNRDKKKLKDRQSAAKNHDDCGPLEIRVNINERVRPKVMSNANITIIKSAIKFDHYNENKNIVRICGEDLPLLRGVAYILESLAGAYNELGSTENEDLIDDILDDLIDEVLRDSGIQNSEYSPDAIIKDFKGNFIVPRTENQEELVESIRTNVITVAKGVAGTGKSALAVAMAVSYILNNRFDRILLVRPLTSVGGKDVGFLPGTLEEKYGPYASPLSESITDLIGEVKYNEWIRTKKIVMTPTSFVRGANFKNSIVIIDEAQNLSEIEIFTLLTRLCHNGKIIITGDESQDDRKDKRSASGLRSICEKLDRIDKVGIVTMTIDDVQRHGIVRDIIEAFE